MHRSFGIRFAPLSVSLTMAEVRGDRLESSNVTNAKSALISVTRPGVPWVSGKVFGRG